MNVRIISSIAFLLAAIPIGNGPQQQPASQPTVEQSVKDTRALQEEVAALKRQVAELQAQLHPKPPFKNIEVGMTLDEANEFLAGLHWKGVTVPGDVVRDVPDTTVYQAYCIDTGGKVKLLFRVDNKTRKIIRIGNNHFAVSPSDADRPYASERPTPN